MRKCIFIIIVTIVALEYGSGTSWDKMFVSAKTKIEKTYTKIAKNF